MKGQGSEARPDQTTAAHDAYRRLLLLAAGVLRLRYSHFSQNTSLSPATAEELANSLEGVAKGYPSFDHIDPKEAIALAHRVVDDDHPELSRMWPGAR